MAKLFLGKCIECVFFLYGSFSLGKLGRAQHRQEKVETELPAD